MLTSSMKATAMLTSHLVDEGDVTLQDLNRVDHPHWKAYQL